MRSNHRSCTAGTSAPDTSAPAVTSGDSIPNTAPDACHSKKPGQVSR
ncbi:hypothetical protein ACFV4N_39910 [Actinosynnema sp. NPDC059797]